MTYEQYKQSGGKHGQAYWEELNLKEEEEKARVREELKELLAPRVDNHNPQSE